MAVESRRHGDVAPTVSVVVPAYNAQASVRRCLECLQAQTLQGLQVVFVDDGSTDGTAREARDILEASDLAYVFLSRENTGPSAARNDGIDRAEGEYLAFMDVDDCADSSMYEKLYRNACENGSDMVICGRHNVDAETGEVLKIQVPLFDRLDGGLSDCPEIAKRTGIFLWDKILRRSIVEEHHLRLDPTLHHAEDYLFLSLFREYMQLVTAVREPLYFYTRSESGTISTSNAYIMDIPKACAAITDEYRAHGFLDATRPYLKHTYLGYYLRRCEALPLGSDELREFAVSCGRVFDDTFPEGWYGYLARRCAADIKHNGVLRQARVTARAFLAPRGR